MLDTFLLLKYRRCWLLYFVAVRISLFRPDLAGQTSKQVFFCFYSYIFYDGSCWFLEKVMQEKLIILCSNLNNAGVWRIANYMAITILTFYKRATFAVIFLLVTFMDKFIVIYIFFLSRRWIGNFIFYVALFLVS